jgi:hypothetical protein
LPFVSARHMEGARFDQISPALFAVGRHRVLLVAPVKVAH